MDISKEMLETFLLNSKVKGPHHIKLLSKGINSHIYLVTANDKKYIITLFTYALDGKTIDLIQRGNEYFMQMGFPLPKVLFIGKIGSCNAVLTTYRSGRVIQPWGNNEYAKVGSLVAAMHLAGEQFATESIKPPLILSLQYDFDSIASKIPESFLVIESQLKNLQQNWPTRLPSGLIHSDIWYKNILFEQEEISAILDFTMPTVDFFTLDLATIIKGIYFSAKSSRPNEDLQSLLAHYQAVRPLSSAELDSLEIMLQCKILYTIIYLLKKAAEIPSSKNNFLALASFNLLKLEDASHISFAKILA